MFSSRNGRHRGVALFSAALLVSVGFTVSAVAIEPAPSAGVPIILAQAAPAKVSFSADQSKRGKERYTATCEDCHGADLRGGLNGGPPIRGSMFLKDFGGGPASNLFLFMSTMMPPEDPGRFSDSVYVDIMAYVLEMNGFEPGAPLPTKVDALDKIVLDK